MSAKNKRLKKALNKNDAVEAGLSTGLVMTKKVLAKHGVNTFDDDSKISGTKEVYDAIHEMAEIAGDAMKERLHVQSDACLASNGTVSGISCGMSRWEALIEMCKTAEKDFDASVRNFRVTLEREVAAIEHSLKKFKRLETHALADDLERIEKSLSNPSVIALMRNQNEA